jgi:hypothetical protein
MYKTFTQYFSMEILVQSVVISVISAVFLYFYIGNVSAALFYGSLTFVLLQIGALVGAIYLLWKRQHNHE